MACIYRLGQRLMLARPSYLNHHNCVRLLSLIQSPDSLPVITMVQAREKLVQYAEASKAAGTKWAGPTSQEGLLLKKMKDSLQSALIPLGSNEDLRRKYLNSHNLVRFGRILEDMDTMAGLICFTHNVEEGKDCMGTRPQSTVTACVDNISIHPERRFDPLKDIRISGHMIHVGQSSMTVLMQVDQELEGEWKKQIESTFIMVARNPFTKGRAYANPLLVESAEEEELHRFGEGSRPSLEDEFSHQPTSEELSVIHNIFLSTIDQKHKTFKLQVKPEHTIWMKDTLLKNVIICFPEQRNIHGKIFGGFLMRQALELAWINACLYCKSRPVLLNVDDIMFRKSVDIGSLLYLSTQLTYTSGPYMQLRVHAEVYVPETEERATTNTFHFTFIAREMPGQPRNDIIVSTVLPSSYSEYMLFLEGKRHFEKARFLQKA
eukprot:GHVU01042878.1.p1 GENE.GHVU01042878.1~~GHVU01042878.1.p1  ORF type:complete len:434 (+),score=29.76 GHVU01042878.1:167-1468(+)